MAIVTNNPVAPDTVISFAWCNCKGNFFSLCSLGGYTITWMIFFLEIDRFFLCFNNFVFPFAKSLE